jgi:hypothetical protein
MRQQRHHRWFPFLAEAHHAFYVSSGSMLEILGRSLPTSEAHQCFQQQRLILARIRL